MFLFDSFAKLVADIFIFSFISSEFIIDSVSIFYDLLIQSEVSQKEKPQYRILTHIYGI